MLGVVAGVAAVRAEQRAAGSSALRRVPRLGQGQRSSGEPLGVLQRHALGLDFIA